MAYSVPAAFSSVFTGDIVTSADGAAFEAVLERWAVNAQRKAAIVVLPKSAQDIALALQHINLPIAVKCGGHSVGGASSCEDGLVIDLSRYLNGVRIDAEGKRAYVAGGAVWKTVDEEAIKHGLAAVGGTVNHTGVGGVTLGGGYGWLSGRQGLAIDNLISATVVTASGEILEVSENLNQELFGGIRGGGSNFGIVSEFVFQLHVQRPTVYAGSLVFLRTPELLSNVKALLNDFWASAGTDDAVFMFVGFNHGGNVPIISLTVFHNGSREAGEAKFKPFVDLGPIMNSVGEIPYEKANTLLNEFAGSGLNRHVEGLSLDPSKLFAPEDTTLAQACDRQSESGSMVSFILELLPIKTIQSRDTEGRCAFRGRDLCNGMVLLTWPKDQEFLSGEAAALAGSFAKELGRPGSAAYSNYDSVLAESARDEQRAEKQFGTAYPRLQLLKAQYDPAMRFNRWFPITLTACS
ncbi:FAD-binding domain-containing protein [Auriculariales sp. MPI-PUGE-AT-0066]|nr:FAD-binding domain-containing protein [Auriculariales sp. MPI-PUGE-AT-0066]